jgi:hypothetical protein
VPSYVPSAPSPKAALGLIEGLSDLVDTDLPIGDLESSAAAYERQVDELVEEDDETATYVRQLEDSFDNALDDAGPADADELVAEVEKFLRDQN